MSSAERVVAGAPVSLLTSFLGILTLSASLQANAAAATEHAEPFPARPVRIVVGFTPGSGTDLLARFVSGKLAERVGQPVIVDNRAGANGIIGAELVAKATPDGHTLLFMSTSHTINAAVYKKLPFDSITSFTALTTLGAGPLVLVANLAFPAGSVKGLIELARSKPNSVRYGIAGIGATGHFAGALFAHATNVQLVNVPYKGGPQALTDLMGGHVQIMFVTAAVALSQIRSGKIKPLGVTTGNRSALMPEVPTIAESGVPGYEMAIWWGALGPAGVPPSIIVRLNAELADILAQPEAAKRLASEGATPSTRTSAEFSRLLVTEIEKWRRVARDASITAE